MAQGSKPSLTPSSRHDGRTALETWLKGRYLVTPIKEHAFVFEAPEYDKLTFQLWWRPILAMLNLVSLRQSGLSDTPAQVFVACRSLPVFPASPSDSAYLVPLRHAWQLSQKFVPSERMQ
jgi:hypothetical protein